MRPFQPKEFQYVHPKTATLKANNSILSEDPLIANDCQQSKAQSLIHSEHKFLKHSNFVSLHQLNSCGFSSFSGSGMGKGEASAEKGIGGKEADIGIIGGPG